MFKTIARVISGDDPNKRARHAEQDMQDTADRAANATNQYNTDAYNADRENFAVERDFAYETAITNWEYRKQIQDYQYAKSLASYEKSQNIYKSQLGYNQQASALAVNDQRASIQDLVIGQAFQREAMHADLMGEIKRGGIQKLEQGTKLYGIKSNRRINDTSIQQNLNQFTAQNTFEKEAKFVEGLQKSGKAALGQAGVSRKKTLQSTAAESFRSLVALDSSLSGARNKAGVDLLKVYVDASLGETQVGLNLDMIELGINAAKEEVKFNNRVLTANMQSAIGQMERNIQQINLQKLGADLQAEANLNLFPEKFDYAPEPQIRPDRIFVEPQQVEAQQVPKGPRVATGVEAAVNIVGEIGQAATMVMGGIGTFNSLFAAAPAFSGAASGLAGVAASPGMFSPTGTYDWSSNTSNIFGNMS